MNKEPSEIAEHIVENIIARNLAIRVFVTEANYDGSYSTMYSDKIQLIYDQIRKYLENEQSSNN